VKQKAGIIGEELATALLESDQNTDKEIQEQRERISILKNKLKSDHSPDSHDLIAIADSLANRSVWIVGGDGWAYDIGYGGLDHVLASGANVNILVLDTEVYSNTGGQMSKATPRAAVAKFAAGGKQSPKKDLAMMAMSYGDVYVARVAMGGSDSQTLKAFVEAERHQGPSLIIAYSHCIAHGYDLAYGMEQQKKAVLSGYWPLFRFNPDLNHGKQNPFQLDSKPPALPLEKYCYNETRYTMLKHSEPQMAEKLLHEAQQDIHDRWERYEQLAHKANDLKKETPNG
jgi:pyruvate-ferredoxin/flavodoxin oxidoreductase